LHGRLGLVIKDAQPRHDGKADMPTRVFCPDCSYELEEWELQLARWLDCPLCGSRLELGVTVPFGIAFA
jgi:hypothetical protein